MACALPAEDQCVRVRAAAFELNQSEWRELFRAAAMYQEEAQIEGSQEPQMDIVGQARGLKQAVRKKLE